MLAADSCQQRACQGEQLPAEAVRQQAIATDAHESLGQHVQEEAAQELHGIEGHDPLLSSVGIITPSEADVLAVEGCDAVVADGHAVGVSAEVAQDMFRSAEGRLGIDEPSLPGQLRDQLLEPRSITEIACRTSQVEQVLTVEMAKSGEKLLAEDGAQNGNRQREQRVAGGDLTRTDPLMLAVDRPNSRMLAVDRALFSNGSINIRRISQVTSRVYSVPTVLRSINFLSPPRSARK